LKLTLSTIGIDSKILKTSTPFADAIVKDYFDGNKAASISFL
jgi:hypothetical protein